MFQKLDLCYQGSLSHVEIQLKEFSEGGAEMSLGGVGCWVFAGGVSSVNMGRGGVASSMVLLTSGALMGISSRLPGTLSVSVLGGGGGARGAGPGQLVLLSHWSAN